MKELLSSSLLRYLVVPILLVFAPFIYLTSTISSVQDEECNVPTLKNIVGKQLGPKYLEHPFLFGKCSSSFAEALVKFAIVLVDRLLDDDLIPLIDIIVGRSSSSENMVDGDIKHGYLEINPIIRKEILDRPAFECPCNKMTIEERLCELMPRELLCLVIENAMRHHDERPHNQSRKTVMSVDLMALLGTMGLILNLADSTYPPAYEFRFHSYIAHDLSNYSNHPLIPYLMSKWLYRHLQLAKSQDEEAIEIEQDINTICSGMQLDKIIDFTKVNLLGIDMATASPAAKLATWIKQIAHNVQQNDLIWLHIRQMESVWPCIQRTPLYLKVFMIPGIYEAITSIVQYHLFPFQRPLEDFLRQAGQDSDVGYKYLYWIQMSACTGNLPTNMLGDNDDDDEYNPKYDKCQFDIATSIVIDFMFVNGKEEKSINRLYQARDMFTWPDFWAIPAKILANCWELMIKHGWLFNREIAESQNSEKLAWELVKKFANKCREEKEILKSTQNGLESALKCCFQYTRSEFEQTLKLRGVWFPREDLGIVLLSGRIWIEGTIKYILSIEDNRLYSDALGTLQRPLDYGDLLILTPQFQLNNDLRVRLEKYLNEFLKTKVIHPLLYYAIAEHGLGFYQVVDIKLLVDNFLRSLDILEQRRRRSLLTNKNT